MSNGLAVLEESIALFIESRELHPSLQECLTTLPADLGGEVTVTLIQDYLLENVLPSCCSRVSHAASYIAEHPDCAKPEINILHFEHRKEVFNAFKCVVEDVHSGVKQFEALLRVVCKGCHLDIFSVYQEMNNIILNAILIKHQSGFLTMLRVFFTCGMEWFAARGEDNLNIEELLKVFKVVCIALNEYNFVAQYSNLVIDTIYSILFQYIHRLVAENYTAAVVGEAVQFIDRVVYPFLQSVFTNKEYYLLYRTRIEHFMYYSICNFRIQQLHQLIILYNKSVEALTDLKICISNTVQYELLLFEVQKLLSNITNDGDFIVFIIKCMKCVAAVCDDSATVAKVIATIRSAGAQRKNVLKHFIHGLVAQSEIHDLLLDELNSTDVEDALKPVELDIFKVIADLFTDKDAFADELQYILGEYMLLNTSDINNVGNIIHLLKSKFGNLVHQCDVMLNDILYSKNINQFLQCSKYSSPQVTCNASLDVIIMNSNYWPNIEETTFTPHPLLDLLASEAELNFMRFNKNKPKHISRLSDMTKYTITVTIADSQVTYTVSGPQLSALLFFTDADTIQISSLAGKLGVGEDALMKICRVWLDSGVLRLEGDILKINDSISESQCQPTIASEERFFSKQKEDENEFATIKKFIVQLLTQNNYQPLNYIYKHMKLHLNFTKSEQQLLQILLRLVYDSTLGVENNVFFASKK